ncbi:MAG TPA: hypothetical protein VKZ45_00640 [Vicingaceae bacterium]|nr:hypothetical protein [Vicingaceae bacterium]
MAISFPLEACLSCLWQHGAQIINAALAETPLKIASSVAVSQA